MNFNDVEMSLDDGTPAVTVEFARPGKVWRYTNCEQNITLEGDVYLSVPLTVSDITQSGESSNDGVNIELPSSCDLSQYLDQIKPSQDIGIKMRKLHMSAQTDGEYLPPVSYLDAPIMWVGTYGLIKRPVPNKRLIQANTISISMARGGLRLAWQRACHHFLYNRGCFVIKSVYAVPVANPTLVSGIELLSPEADAYVDGYFTAGFVEWNSEPGVIEKRGIESHYNGSLIIFGGTEGMEQGTNFVLYPGCDHTPSHCNGKFNNMLNYGGINFLQGRSPFDGDPVF